MLSAKPKAKRSAALLPLQWSIYIALQAGKSIEMEVNEDDTDIKMK